METAGGDAEQDAQAIRSLAAGRPALVWRRQLADTETPVAAALKLIEPGRGDFVLESVEDGATRGRYSLIGLAPDLVFRADGTEAAINRDWLFDRGAFRPVEGGPLKALRSLVAECRAEVPDGLPTALACLVGYFAYETVGLVETLPRPAPNPLDLPDMLFVRPTLILVFDRLADALYLVAPVWPGNPEPSEAIERAVERIEAAAAQLAGAVPQSRRDPGAIALPVPTPQLALGRYGEMVARAKEYIAAGDIFQVVLAQRFTTPFPLPPFDLYRSLRRINPSPFLYHLDLPGFALIGSSPEILVRVRDGEVTIRPIAGTRPRGKTAAEDAANRDELLADPKERAEHIMLIDLERNDLGRVCEAGSVVVDEYMVTESYAHVHHIVSNVRGRLRADRSPVDALRALFPGGTITGCPKVRCMQIIAELEGEGRGAYTGSLGWLGTDGDSDFNILIRTLTLRDDLIELRAGAGIVADSVPERELAETRAKARGMLRAFGVAS